MQISITKMLFFLRLKYCFYSLFISIKLEKQNIHRIGPIVSASDYFYIRHTLTFDDDRFLFLKTKLIDRKSNSVYKINRDDVTSHGNERIKLRNTSACLIYTDF